MSETVLKIKKLNLVGNGCASNGGRDFEVPFSLPGETLTPDVKKKKGSTHYALPKEFIKTSKDRIKPDCKHFGTCGACHYRHVSYEKSLQFKAHAFEEALRKLVPQLPSFLVFESPRKFGYRNNARFYIEHGQLTQHKMLTHDNFPLKECFVISKHTWKTAQEVLPLLPKECTELMIRENEEGSLMFVLSGPGITMTSPLLDQSTYTYDTEKKTYIHVGGPTTLPFELHLIDHSLIFDIGPDSFFQVNSSMAELLYSYVIEHCPEHGTVLDLYSGTGTIGISLAAQNPEVTVICVEINEEMTTLGKENALKNDIHTISFLQGDARSMKFENSPSCIIVDPPRKGLTPEALEHMKELSPEQIIYVSCNPTTFIRDLQHLLPHYTLQETALFDMMPFTSHMEVVGVLERSKN